MSIFLFSLLFRNSTKLKCGNSAKILNKIIDCEVLSSEEECVLIGTVYKEMKLKPSILDEFKDNYGISASVLPLGNFSSDDDSLTLEDESGRIRLGGLLGKPDVIAALVTGVVLGVKGHVETVGTFTVNDIILPGDNLLYSRIALNTTALPTPKDADQHILLVSGLKFGSVGSPISPSTLFSTQLLLDYIAGRIGESNDAVPKSIVKVIIAGNSVVESTVLSKDKAVSAKQQAAAVAPLNQFDMFLAQLLASCPVDVLPGETDPSSINFPQQPLHPCLLPRAVRFKTNLKLVTNPYESSVAVSTPNINDSTKLRILGHSGKPLSDIALQTSVAKTVSVTSVAVMDVETDANDDTGADTNNSTDTDIGAQYLTMLENTVKWGNFCPTAPDSLPCYAFVDKDPFVLDLGADDSAMPDVIFAGNSPAYTSSLFESKDKRHKTRIVCVPSFHQARQVVLLNVNTLETNVLSFQ